MTRRPQNTKIGGSLIVMAIVGGAVLTPLMGLISVRTGSIALAHSIPLVAYIVIAFYSFCGSTQRGPAKGTVG
jgi:FHS family L-fucose permease-like MFS transporter